MPTAEFTGQYQFAVLWSATGARDRHDQPFVALVPVEIQAKINTKRTVTQDAMGNKVALDATAVISQLVPVDSILWIGRLQTYNTLDLSAITDVELFRVATYDEVSDVKGRFFTRTLGLQRFRSSLPPQA